jgi:hypothetical protein
MKKLILAFSFVLGGLVVVNAQDTTSTQNQNQQYPTSTTQDDQDRERINSRDLPDQVKRSLEGTEYRGWLVNAAYKTTGVSGTQGDSTSVGDSTAYRTQGTQGSQSDTSSVSGNTGNTGAYGQEVFVVELKNGAQTKTVRFDKDGNKLDDGGENDQDQK